MFKNLRWLVLIALVTVVPVSVFAGTQEIERQFDVEPGQEIRLALQRVRGEIQITGWDKNRVEITGRMRGSDWREDDELEFDQSSSGIDVAPSFRVRDDDRVIAELKIMVPREFDVQLRAHADTRVTDLRGDVDLSVGNADLDLDNVHGESEIGVANGKLNVENCTLDGEVSAVNGRLSIDKSDIKGEVASVNANMTVSRAPEGIDVSSTNGNIDIGIAKDHVRAETVNGRVKIDELDGWIEAETVNGAVELRMVGGPDGKRSVEIETVNGDVEIEIPENFSMKFDIEVKSENRHHEIVSDFDLDIQDESGRRHYKQRGKGSIGGGRNTVYIRATNGDVILKRVAKSG